jgi:hypothetical protein
MGLERAHDNPGEVVDLVQAQDRLWVPGREALELGF